MDLDADARKRVRALKAVVVKHFNHGHWRELSLITGTQQFVDSHPRLLRSLSFNDPDYEGCALEALMHMASKDAASLGEIEAYVSETFGHDGMNISSAQPEGQTIVFQPSVFQIPEEPVDQNLLSAMMPFVAGFGPVHEAIKRAAHASGLECKRADDIWVHSTIIQDVFSLIFRSFIVVCDFTGKNPNVFYEAGIAHTLGKHVIPIAQHESDIPFDLKHHRYIHYLSNSQGLADLEKKLIERIGVLLGQRAKVI